MMFGECSICQEIFTTKISALHCGHTFHEDCITAWLKRSETCPQCRTKATEKQLIHQLYFGVPKDDTEKSVKQPEVPKPAPQPLHQANIGPRKLLGARHRPQSYSPYTLTPHRNNEFLQQPVPNNNLPLTNNTVQYTPPNKPTVYLLPMGDGGHRMLKFVLKDGRPAPNHLVDQVLPALRQQANTLPKGIVTVTVDSVEDNGNETAASTSQQNMDQQPCTSGQARSAAVSDPVVDNEMRQQATKVASQLNQLLMYLWVGSNQNKIFGLGNSQYLSVIEGQPWILNKEDSGNYRKFHMIDRGELERKLREIQLSRIVEQKRQEQQKSAA